MARGSKLARLSRETAKPRKPRGKGPCASTRARRSRPGTRTRLRRSRHLRSGKRRTTPGGRRRQIKTESRRVDPAQRQGLPAAFGARPLFEDVSFTVEEGDRIGLIGPERRRQVDAAADPGRHRRRRATQSAWCRGGAGCASGSWSRCRGSRPAPPSEAVIAGGVPRRGATGNGRATTRRDGEARAGGPAAAAASRPRRRSRRCRAAGGSGWRWRASWRASRICCCSTSRPTTWTSRASSGSSGCSRAAGSRPSRSPTIGSSCSGSRPASSSSIGATRAGCSRWPATTAPTCG